MIGVQNMKILIIEDDVMDSTDLIMKLENLKVKEKKLVMSFDDGIAEIDGASYDLVFIDVFLDGQEKGSEVAKYLSSKSIPFIVMTKFADISFFDDIKNYNPLAYFQKPVDPLALRYRLESLCKQMNDKKSDFIFHRTGTDYRRFEKATINYVQGEGNYVSVYTDDERILLRQSLKSFLSTLDSSLFVQIHRKWAVRLSKVDAYNSEENIILIGDLRFPVGRTFQSGLIKRLRS